VPPLLAPIVPTHNSAAVLPHCLAALRQQPSLAITVVDNHSYDDSVLVAKNFKVLVVGLSENGGFSRACNAGVAAAPRDADWLVFVNPDVIVDGSELVRIAREAPPSAVALSPLLVDEYGHPLRDIARSEPSLWATLRRYLFSSAVDRSAQRLYEGLKEVSERYVAVEVTSGGCLLVRAPAFHAVDGFSEAYFFNMEDVELSCRLRASGGTIMIDRTAVGLHAKGTSSSSVTREQRMLECARAEVLFFERNRPGWQVIVVGPPIFLGCLARMVLNRSRASGSETWSTFFPRVTQLVRVLAKTFLRLLRNRQPPVPAHSVFFHSPSPQ
jgi:N-acetylglucosaminyl-diphospho-decaprenol L-rhamnosyltransferase